MVGKHPQLSVAPQPAGAKPNPQQKRFNSLLKKIETHRSTLEGWSTAEQAYTQLWAEEFTPAVEQLSAVQLELLRTVDAASSQIKLSKQDRATLTDIVCGLVEDLMDESHPDSQELKEIFARHSGEDFDDVQQEELAHFKAHMEHKFDLDLSDGDHITSEHEFVEFLQEKLSSYADAADRDEQLSEPPKKSAHERRKEEDQAKSSQSVREVYRKLASALHPDRETDEHERTRKTDLMQRVNKAYAEKDLLSLLQLQLEIEQIDTDHISNLPLERIKHYNRVLAEQVKDLEEEIHVQNMIFNGRFALPPYETTKPAQVPRKCNKVLNELDAELFDMEQEVAFLQESPKNIKVWLRAQRNQLDDMLDSGLLDDLFR
ncbi:J domain-containing protein [Pseudomonas syringae group sp. J309-1]|uniref:J domain-containing protein n=1 Tax=Pseudomonas syringae group sp. J309-1 TaxID=3079588 RepID=UPI00290CE55B|nr:J domain-containing protein [Pseudomonas syringae group sp. J309-1]MDU8357253.1 J domain-containing protein [Pseudomonas syringae group sp. J309-1]